MESISENCPLDTADNLNQHITFFLRKILYITTGCLVARELHFFRLSPHALSMSYYHSAMLMDITYRRCYDDIRCLSIPNEQTDFPDNLDVSTSCQGAISVPNAEYHGKTSADFKNK